MTPQSPNTSSDGSGRPLFKAPADWWCKWMALKGTNFRHIILPSADLRNKLVVITGSNSGIGREAALQFAKWGADVILGCREPPPHEMHPGLVVEECKRDARAAGHDKSNIEWYSVDMTELKTVENFGKRLLESGRPIDILVNNAGIPGSRDSPRFTGDGFEIVHQVNLLSHVLLTLSVLPCIAKAPTPRIICTTSCMQYLGIFDLGNANSGRNSYANNKLYFQTWLTELQQRMSECTEYKHVIIQGVHPGYVKTNIWNSTSKATKDKPVESRKKMSWIEWGLNVLLEYVGIDAQQGSLCITNAATASWLGWDQRELGKPCGSEKVGGRYLNRIWDETPMPQTEDRGCRRMVWEFVNKELNLEEKGLLSKLGV